MNMNTAAAMWHIHNTLNWWLHCTYERLHAIVPCISGLYQDSSSHHLPYRSHQCGSFLFFHAFSQHICRNNVINCDTTESLCAWSTATILLAYQPVVCITECKRPATLVYKIIIMINLAQHVHNSIAYLLSW